MRECSAQMATPKTPRSGLTAEEKEWLDKQVQDAEEKEMLDDARQAGAPSLSRRLRTRGRSANARVTARALPALWPQHTRRARVRALSRRSRERRASRSGAA